MPITLLEFKEHLGDVTFPLAVAVSGGADSLALLLLAHEVAQQQGSYVIGLTVDHGLRPESKEEALQVNTWANERGIQHVILEWINDKPTSRLQEKARKARYDLLTEWCHQNQISTILLGHHQQDQEETFWLRLAAGSGLDGLAGMKKFIVKEDIQFMRPFLNIPKEQIQEILRAHNQDWIEDPSNQNPRFFRGRLRHFLAEEGLSASRLQGVMAKLQRDADFIQDSLRNAIEKVVQVHEGGYLTLKKEAFQTLHSALAERLLSLVAQWYSGRSYPPRGTQILAVIDKINQGSPFTMGGIYWVTLPKDIILFRERRAMKDVLSLDQLDEPTLWDHRFWIDPGIKDEFPSGTTIQALGNPGLDTASLRTSTESVAIRQNRHCEERSDAAIQEQNNNSLQMSLKFKSGLLRPALCRARNNATVCNNNANTIPKRAWSTLPALWEKGKVVAVPHLCYDLLGCREDLRKFINLKPLFHDSLRFTI